jgi:hypothetical protein
MRYATYIVGAFLSFLVASGCASTSPSTLPPDTEYQVVREVEDVSADEIYGRSLNWMAETFVSANDAIQVRDDENNRLVANAELLIPDLGGAASSEMSIIVEARDGRFRFTARNFRLNAMGTRAKMNEELYGDLKPKLKSQADELQSYIRGETEDTDW